MTKTNFVNDILEESKFAPETGVYKRARRTLLELKKEKLHAIWCCLALNTKYIGK